MDGEGAAASSASWTDSPGAASSHERTTCAANGGALRLFEPHERGYGTADSLAAPYVEDVLPEGGTLVLMMSGDVEHQVLETLIERQCIVGWFKELESQRTPDLDSTSLRTLRMLGHKETSASCRALAEDLDRSGRV